MDSLGSDEAGTYFQEFSGLMKEIGLNFAGKRHLTDLLDWHEITLSRLLMLDEKIEEGTCRFKRLCSLLSINEPDELPGLFESGLLFVRYRSLLPCL